MGWSGENRPISVTVIEAGRRDSNPQQLAWKASALPLRLRPRRMSATDVIHVIPANKNGNGKAGKKYLANKQI